MEGFFRSGEGDFGGGGGFHVLGQYDAIRVDLVRNQESECISRDEIAARLRMQE